MTIMPTSTKESYILYVEEADLTPWTGRLSNDTLGLYVEIRLEDFVACTKVAEGDITPYWDEEFIFVGHTSSIISLSIKHSISDNLAPHPCIGHVDVVLNELLSRCSNDEYATLEVKSVIIDTNSLPIIGVITMQLVLVDDWVDKLSDLGHSQLIRFELLNNLADLEHAIQNLRKAVKLADDKDAYWPHHLSNLAICQNLRFSRLGELADISDAIMNLQRAADLTDDDDISKPTWLLNLGAAQANRFEQLGHLPDLEDSLTNLTKAVKLSYDGYHLTSSCLSHLGMSQRLRFQNLDRLPDLHDSLLNLRKAADLTDDGHPDKPGRLSNLGSSRLLCFMRLGNVTDLEGSILNHRNAASLTHDDHPNKPALLANLGLSLQSRFIRFAELADIEDSISNLERSVELTIDGHPSKPRFLLDLGNSKRLRFGHLDVLSDLEDSILALQQAAELTNEGDVQKAKYLFNLGVAQQRRFKRLGKLADIEDSISNLLQSAQFTYDGHSSKPLYLSHLAGSQKLRFERLGTLTDLEDSRLNLKRAIELTDDGHPSKLERITDLANLILCRRPHFHHVGQLTDLKDILASLKMAAEVTEDGYSFKTDSLARVGNSQRILFEGVGEVNDLENSISNLRTAVELTDNGPDKINHLSNLSNSQYRRFQCLGELPDIDNSISNKKRAIELIDDGHPYYPILLSELGQLHHRRFDHIHEMEDFRASIFSYREAARSKTAYPLNALDAARNWAIMAHVANDRLSAMDGYRTALEILPKLAWLGLDAPSRQHWVSQRRPELLSCFSATCAIQLDRLEEAVELLDMGRSVFWRQASSLRADLEILKEEEPELAAEFETLGRQLDASIFSDSLSTIREQNIVGGDHSPADTGRGRRHLVQVWEGLLERVRQLPKFEYFLKPLPFRRLRQAATTGQVVIVNVCPKFGVDALIFGADRPIEHVPLVSIDFETIDKMSGDVLRKRPTNATAAQQRNHTTHYLKPALRTVWHDIMVPIFEKMQISVDANVIPKVQHRIWWYPTGPLTFIPIHAAGPGKGTVDVSRLVISSYVTTLNSLCQAKEKNESPSIGQVKFLIVSQPETPGQNSLPQSMDEVEKVARVARSAGLSIEEIDSLCGIDATVDRVSGALDICTWAHFACHGMQSKILGMESALALYDGYLQLGHIASKRLPIGQFAFLSVCHGASGVQDLPGEAIHLAAGLQFAGFPSVIATMWRISDKDAPKIAHHTYQYLFRNGLQGFNPSEAAKGLNHAILHLCEESEDPTMTVDRWAPFIHFGI